MTLLLLLCNQRMLPFMFPPYAQKYSNNDEDKKKKIMQPAKATCLLWLFLFKQVFLHGNRIWIFCSHHLLMDEMKAGLRYLFSPGFLNEMKEDRDFTREEFYKKAKVKNQKIKVGWVGDSCFF